MKRRTQKLPDKPKSQSPTPEQIQQRAYEIFLARGVTPGHEIDDWLLAELEFKSREYQNGEAKKQCALDQRSGTHQQKGEQPWIAR